MLIDINFIFCNKNDKIGLVKVNKESLVRFLYIFVFYKFSFLFDLNLFIWKWSDKYICLY